MWHSVTELHKRDEWEIDAKRENNIRFRQNYVVTKQHF